MIKNNFLQRLILTVIAIPAIVLILTMATWAHNIAVCAVLAIMAFLGSLELCKMLFNEKKYPISVLSSLQVFAGFFDSLKIVDFPMTMAFLMLIVLIVFSRSIFEKNDDDFAQAVGLVPKKVFIAVYPSFMLSFAPMILNCFESGNILFLFMLFLIFANDSFCYVGGKLFGKNNKGLVKVSPNKSIAGFISGFIFTFIIGYVYMLLYRSVFAHLLEKVWVFAIISVCTSLLANIGDLAESMLKRGVKIKDSGSAVLGRGGIMDSIDSIVMLTPFFYFALLALKSFELIA